MSQRDLARRTARRLGQPDRAEALQRAISRIERGDRVAIAPEVIDALAKELGLRAAADLIQPYRWVFRNTGAGIPGDPITWLGDRLPVFSSLHGAWMARGWVTLAEGRVIRSLELSHPYEAFHTELVTELRAHGSESSMLLDAPAPVFRALAGMPLAAAAV